MTFIASSLSFKDLPLPTTNKRGWPWQEQSQETLKFSSLNFKFPKISIITPSYNQGQYIEETIRSVLLQEYPNLEYIIIDGGSTDNTIDIIKKYEKYLTYWVSEPDKGQAHAINKGLQMITGDIWAYVNSDDLLTPRTLKKVAEKFQQNADLLWVTGYADYINETGTVVETMIPATVNLKKEALIRWEGARRPICIEASNFMSRKVIERYGFYDLFLNCCMDFEYNLRLFFDDIVPLIIPQVLAQAHLHPESKTVSLANSNAFRKEDLKIIERYLSQLNKKDANTVKRKALEMKYWLDIQDVRQCWHNTGKIQALKKMLSQVFENPQYLLKRPTLGEIKRMII